jgi:hypothetical protein
MPKTAKEVQRFIDVLEEAGYEPTSYSGRGMYGKFCVSVQGDDVSVWEVARSLRLNHLADEDLDIPEPRQDQLGLGIVLYWPSYPFPLSTD